MSCREVVGMRGWEGLYRAEGGCQKVVGMKGGEGMVGSCCGLRKGSSDDGRGGAAAS